jgi:hypothetical protein
MFREVFGGMSKRSGLGLLSFLAAIPVANGSYEGSGWWGVLAVSLTALAFWCFYTAPDRNDWLRK